MNQISFILSLKEICQLSIIDNKSVSDDILRGLRAATSSNKIKARIDLVLKGYDSIDLNELTYAKCKKITEDPNCPSDILLSAYEKWRGHGDEGDFGSIGCQVAKHPNANRRLLDILKDSEYWRVRDSVAENRNAHPDILIHLLKNDEDCDVVRTLINNPATPVQAIIDELRQSKRAQHNLMDEVLLECEWLPAEVLDDAIQDGSSDEAIWTVIDNPSTAIETLVWIRDNPNGTSLHRSQKGIGKSGSGFRDDAAGAIEERLKACPSLKSDVERFEAQAQLGIRPSVGSIDLSKIDI